MTRTRRRELLATMTAATVPGIAGCTDLLEEDTDEETPADDEPSDDGESSDTGDGNDEAGEDDAEEEHPETIEEAATLFVEDVTDERFADASERFRSTVRARVGAPGRIELVWLGLTAVGGEFEAIVGTEATVVSGFDAVDVRMAFERGTHALRVVVTSDLEVQDIGIADDYERPSYVDLDAIDEESVTVETGSCQLNGLVTTPANADGDVPGVVLVHGSGPSDMDVDNGGTRLFQDLAEGLASNGVAALRYEKRNPACPPDLADYTLDTVTVDPALAALEELRTVEGVDPDRIAVVGHSLGGMAVPRLAARDGDLVGGVALAAPARSFHDLTVDQVEHQATVIDHEWPQLTAQYEDWVDRVDRIRAGDYNPSDLILEYPGAFWDSLDAYDHLGTAQEIDAPLYFLQGERDYQVTLEDDFEQWQEALVERSDIAFDRYDGLNHLLMSGEGPSVPTEYPARNNVDERVVADVAGWIRER
ncbi:alpha/beta hydrolase family protein [Halopiger goleimassiliensis]|uniref:alpha/beta hydrolase family protein n=1 Tax=Halopiger goleimassiliensis TaxID=1293048 RepID=UPI0006781FD1|nr:alpha/beta fold hydrolase [Halopiger goleimassiliensis]